jgi:hypothetical protein
MTSCSGVGDVRAEAQQRGFGKGEIVLVVGRLVGLIRAHRASLRRCDGDRPSTVVVKASGTVGCGPRVVDPLLGDADPLATAGALDAAVIRRHDQAMNVEEINIGPSDAIAPVQAASALAGKGLQGDRHFCQQGATPGEALTLIEAEVLESVGLTGAESRRQVVVRGVRLNDLVGKRFRVGDVECLGVELCEPCLHLQQLTRPGIIKELVHRAGLNADILNDGWISVGDAVIVHERP